MLSVRIYTCTREHATPHHLFLLCTLNTHGEIWEGAVRCMYGGKIHCASHRVVVLRISAWSVAELWLMFLNWPISEGLVLGELRQKHLQEFVTHTGKQNLHFASSSLELCLLTTENIMKIWVAIKLIASLFISLSIKNFYSCMMSANLFGNLWLGC